MDYKKGIEHDGLINVIEEENLYKSEKEEKKED